jgi:hypothetical protein
MKQVLDFYGLGALRCTWLAIPHSLCVISAYERLDSLFLFLEGIQMQILLMNTTT